MNQKYTFHFRWPIRPTSDVSVEMTVPIGEGPSIINPQFATEQSLGDGELLKAEAAVIRAIAIID